MPTIDRLKVEVFATMFLGFAGACASTPGAAPDDMSAQEHRETAAAHQGQAEAHEEQYDPEASAVGTPGSNPGRGVPRTYNPTAEHARHAEKHREHAADHEAAAQELEAFTEQECAQFTPEVREACPLMGKVVSFKDIDEKQGGPAVSEAKHGVRIYFGPDVDTDAVIAHMRCHLAFARKMGRKGMNHCPLYVEGVALQTESAAPGKGMHGGKGHGSTAGASTPGSKTEGAWRAPNRVRVEKGAEAQSVDLLVDDESLLKELRERVRAHVPKGD